MSDVPDKQKAAAENLAAMVEPKIGAKKRPYRVDAKAREKMRAEMNAFAESGDWTKAKGSHLVALYEWCHEQVYGVATAELDGRNWAFAAQAATRIVEQHFGGDYGQATLFLRWTWSREREREAWRRENGKGGQVIGWRLQFSGTLLTQWKIDQARQVSR